jgi:hypothetical protein
MDIPSWYELLLLALAAYRIWYLLGQDTILDRPRRSVTTKSEYVETLLECPYCAGFWVSLAVWGAWQAWPHGTLVVAGALAVAALVPLIERITSDE